MVSARLVQPEPEKVRAETLFDGIQGEFRLYAVVPPPCWWGWVVKSERLTADGLRPDYSGRSP